MNPLVVAITGATGAIYGIRLFPGLREKSIAVQSVLSTWAGKTKIGP